METVKEKMIKVDIVGVDIQVDKVTNELDQVFVITEINNIRTNIPANVYFDTMVDSFEEYLFVHKMIVEALEKTAFMLAIRKMGFKF